MNGIPHGARLEWYKNEQKKLKYFYSYGTKNGTWSAWYPDGSKKHMYSYKNGQKDVEMTYKDGELDGLRNKWYENGDKKSQST